MLPHEISLAYSIVGNTPRGAKMDSASSMTGDIVAQRTLYACSTVMAVTTMG